MTIGYSDYIVVGESLAGIAAALTLAQAGNQVVLVDILSDIDRVVDLPRVQATLLGGPTDGATFYQSIRQRFIEASIEHRHDFLVNHIRAEHNVIVDSDNDRLKCGGLIYAPNGAEPGLEVSRPFQGFGTSYSASHDATFFKSKKVAAYGDAPRVIEHAWTAFKLASTAVVLLKGNSIEGDSELLKDLQSSSSVMFHQSVDITTLRGGDDQSLQRVDFDTQTGHHSIEVSALFIAQHVVPMLNVFDGDTQPDRIALAGLAAGVNYWEHAALVNDGIRAARALMSNRQERRMPPEI